MQYRTCVANFSQTLVRFRQNILKLALLGFMLVSILNKSESATKFKVVCCKRRGLPWEKTPNSFFWHSFPRLASTQVIYSAKWLGYPIRCRSLPRHQLKACHCGIQNGVHLIPCAIFVLFWDCWEDSILLSFDYFVNTEFPRWLFECPWLMSCHYLI